MDAGHVANFVRRVLDFRIEEVPGARLGSRSLIVLHIRWVWGGGLELRAARGVAGWVGGEVGEGGRGSAAHGAWASRLPPRACHLLPLPPSLLPLPDPPALPSHIALLRYPTRS